ncbi:hypothetical protein NMY22_g1741 [Coprinellus aureogranulatus]|nr:hypothetical protein NMY22_g1741 [Coprinellus aureogranulatus]
MHTFRHQPLKGLYLVYQFVSTLFIRLPFWILSNTPRSLRPRPSWPVGRGVVVKLVRHVMTIQNQTGPWAVAPDYRTLTLGEGVNGIWIEPAHETEILTGDIARLARIADVSPTRLPGYWQHKKKTTDIEVGSGFQLGEKVLYNLHGGAYIRMSAHPSDPTANIVKGILKYVPSIKRAFSVEYRLSSTKPLRIAHPFPTALIDALTGYHYLVDGLSIPPSDIVVCGDSAGANLAHALTRYLVENAADPRIPMPPGALILLSPWSDMSKFHEDLQGGSATSCASSDYVTNKDGGADWAKDAFCGPHGREIAESHPYVSPASLLPGFTVSFKGFPRTFIVGGGAEVLIDQIRTLKNRMVKDIGEGDGVKEGEGKVRYHEAPDAIHDYLCFPWHEPERSDTLRHIAEWVEAC